MQGAIIGRVLPLVIRLSVLCGQGLPLIRAETLVTHTESTAEGPWRACHGASAEDQ